MKLRSARVLPFMGSVLLVLWMAVSCSSSGSGGFIGGETVTPERLAEISAEIFTQAQTEPVTADPADTLSPEDMAYTGSVYWTGGGQVWHTDRDCYHIRNAEEVMEGSTADAAAAGKRGLCSACRKRQENQT